MSLLPVSNTDLDTIAAFGTVEWCMLYHLKCKFPFCFYVISYIDGDGNKLLPKSMASAWIPRFEMSMADGSGTQGCPYLSFSNEEVHYLTLLHMRCDGDALLYNPWPFHSNLQFYRVSHTRGKIMDSDSSTGVSKYKHQVNQKFVGFMLRHRQHIVLEIWHLYARWSIELSVYWPDTLLLLFCYHPLSSNLHTTKF